MKFLKSLFVLFVLASAAFGQHPTRQDLIIIDTVDDFQNLRFQPRAAYDGRLIRVKDGVRGGDFVYDANSTAQVNSGTIFWGPGFEATGRFIRQHDNSVYHVDWFGSIPGDNQDDWINIATCISTAVNEKTGGRIYDVDGSGGPSVVFGSGVYDISLPLEVPTSTDDTDSKLTIRGQGNFSTVIQPMPGKDSDDIDYLLKFEISGAATGNRHWILQDLQFNGKRSSGDAETGIKGVNANKSSYFVIDRCSFHYLDVGVSYRNWSNTISNSVFRFCGDGVYITEEDGIGGQSTINDLRLEGCIFGTCSRAGFRQSAATDINYVKIDDCQFDGATPVGVVFNGPVDQFHVNQCYFEAQGRSGSAMVYKHHKRGSAPWVHNTVYGTHSVVTDLANGDYWYSAAGGVSNGTDVSDDAGVTWEPLETYVEGAIVVVPSKTNTAGNGRITDNTFFNCDKQTAIHLEEVRQIHISGNKGSGVAQNHFVTLGADMGRPAAGYTIGQTIHIDHSRWSITDREIWSKILHIEGSGSYTDTPNDMTGITIIDRTPVLDAKKTFAFNDLTNTKVWKSDPLYVRPYARMNDAGVQEFHWDTSGQACGVVGVFLKTPASIWDGTYMKQFGNVLGDAQTNIRIDIQDGNRPFQRMSITKSQPNIEGINRNGLVYFEPASPYDDWEGGVTYSVGDIVRSKFRDDEYICTAGGLTLVADSDRDLAGEFGDASDTVCTWLELDSSVNELGLDWATATDYKAGEKVRSAETGEWFSCDTDHTSDGSDDDLAGGSDTGGGWTLLADDPTEEVVTIRIYNSSTSATNPVLRNFALCSASYDRFNVPVLSQPIEERAEVNLKDYYITPATNRWAYVSLVGTFEQGESITWTGGSGRLLFFDQAFDYMLVDDITGTLPASGTTITGSDSGATCNTNGGPLNRDERALVTAIDDAMVQRRPLRIPAGTYDLANWGNKSITSDLVVRCDEGAILDGPSVGVTLFTLPASGGAGLDWQGGKVMEGRRLVLLQTIDGATTPFLRLRDMEFQDMASIVEDATGTTPANLTDLLIENVNCTAVERGINIQYHQFGQGKIHNVSMDAGRPVESTPLYGIWLGMGHSSTSHGTVSIEDFTLTDYENATTNRNHALRLHGPNFQVRGVRIADQQNGSGTATTNSESIYLQVSDSTFRDIWINDGGQGTSTLFVDGIDRDVTHSIAHTGGPTGNFEPGEAITWSGGTGVIHRVGSTASEIELSTGSAPGSSVVITGSDSSATMTTSSAATDISTSEPRGHGNLFDNVRIIRTDAVQAKAIQMNTSGNTVHNCYFENGSTGVQMKGNRNNFLTSTFRSVGSVGSTLQMIQIEGANNRVTGCLFDRVGNQRNINIQGEGLISSGNIVSDNIFQFPTHATAYGLFVRGKVGNTGPTQTTVATGNSFRGYNTGIRVETTNVEDLTANGNLFKDCTSDTHDAGGTNIDFGGAAVTAYAMMHGTNEGTTQAGPTAITKQLWFNTAGPSNNVTIDTTADDFEVNVDGTFLITFNVMTNGTDGSWREFFIYKNGVQLAQSWSGYSSSAYDNASIVCVAECSAGDDIDVRLACQTSSNMSYWKPYFSIVRIGD